MRAELSIIQQTLSPEAATVLSQSVAEAGRRKHGQTTPLHVAAALLSSSSGFLRQACIKSHPNSSHPLQCRALELCFSVALDRLPTAQGSASVVEPTISNALMAALKRAQAHQRRGCPELQQQPMLAVKVELEQLVLSILDDPSVSRVMREASFSSLAVKATIEQSSSDSGSVGSNSVSSSSVGLGLRPSGGCVLPAPVNQNLYLNPRLQQPSGVSSQAGLQRGEDVKGVVEILTRRKKRNPVLVGETGPEMVIKEVLRRIESHELAEGVLKNVEVICLEKDFLMDRMKIPGKISKLGGMLEERIGNFRGNTGVILYLGDLKWIVEQPGSLGGVYSSGLPQQVVPEVGRAAVVQMTKLLARFGEGGNYGRLWLIGCATCETYLRCQVYHPSMENDWDLQAVPIAAKAPLPGMFPMLGSNSIKIAPLDPRSLNKGFPAAPAVLSTNISENLDPARKLSCCPECTKSYEKELSTLKEFEKSEFSAESSKSQLPQWLQSAKEHVGDVKTMSHSQTKGHEMTVKRKRQELQKKWKDVCYRDHPNFHQHNIGLERIIQTPSLTTPSFYNPKLLQTQTFQPNLQMSRNLGGPLQLKPTTVTYQPPLQKISPPRSPVRTELALGRTKVSETVPENTHKEQTRDFLGRMPDEPQNTIQEMQSEKLVSMLDADFFKRLIKGLIEKVWWQREAASMIATSVIQCKVGDGKRQSKGDIWLFFTGPDTVGKRKMATALSDLVNGAGPIMINLRSRRSDGEPNMSFRGKTAVDKIVEAVRRNPFSVVMLEDIDEADILVRGSIKRAVERGRLADSHGREISLGNVIFLVTASWLPDNLKKVSDGQTLDDEKLANLASKGLQLRLSLWEKTVKRRANWLHDERRNAKSRKDSSLTLSLDLNEAVDIDDGRANSSFNSSDLTIDQEVEHGLLDKRLPMASSFCGELLKCVDDSIVFKQVELGAVQRDIANLITKRFCGIMDDNISIEVQVNALEKILGGLWVSGTSLEEWTEKVLVPSFRQLKSHLLSTATDASLEETLVFQLEIDKYSESHDNGDWLPSRINLVTIGL